MFQKEHILKPSNEQNFFKLCNMKINVLAIVAHPDDLEISAAGTFLKLKSQGYKTGVIDLTAGELGTRGNALTRKEEAENATKILDLDARENLGFADGFFEINEDSLKKIITIIRKYQPDIIITNSIHDRHPDHGRASQLVARAAYLSGLRKIETTQNGEVQKEWRPKATYFFIQDRFIQPDFVVDISDFMDKKIEAIKAFKTQFYDPESKEPETPISGQYFLDFIRGRGREFGRPVGYEYAEGFCTERYVGVANLMDLS